LRREILITGDGSVTIHLPDWNEQYHSKHGAITEAIHVFINAGLNHWVQSNPGKSISILEIGFGTGLNTFLTFLESVKKNLQIKYTGIEAYPISISEIQKLNYSKILDTSEKHFLELHNTSWKSPSEINQNFQLTKRKQFFSEIADEAVFNIIYFDAFGARVQPDLWTEEIFSKMFLALKTNGVLVTYSAKGSVRRAMQSVGFKVEKIPGPPGKREMLRGTKS